MSIVLSQRSSDQDGACNSNDETQQCKKQDGQCNICGRITHRSVGSFWNKTWQPLTIVRRESMTNDSHNVPTEAPTYIVYKGYCLETTKCYTLQEAKSLYKERKSQANQLGRKGSSHPSSASSSQRQPSSGRHSKHSSIGSSNGQGLMGLFASRSHGSDSRNASDTSNKRNTSKRQAKSPVAKLFLGINGVDPMDNPSEICRVLYEHGDDAHVANLGFKYLCQALSSTSDDINTCRMSKEWIPMLLAKIQQHVTQPEIVNKAIIVLRSVVLAHKERIVQDEGIDTLSQVLTLYSNQTGIQERACDLLAHLVQNETKMEDQLVIALVSSLANVIQSCTAATRAAALQALHHLTQTASGAMQFKQEDISFKNLLNMALDSSTERDVREAIMHLISQIIDASHESATDRPLATEEQVARMTRKWSLWSTPRQIKVALDLISRSFMVSAHAPQAIKTWLSCAEVALSSMRIYPNQETIQAAAMRATVEVLAENRGDGPLAAILHSGSVLSLVSTAMASFSHSRNVIVTGWNVIVSLQTAGDKEIPSLSMIRLFRTQVLHDSKLDMVTKKTAASTFADICGKVLDQTTINNSGILIDIDKATRIVPDTATHCVVLQLFLKFLSIAHKVNTKQSHTSDRPTKVYGTKIIQRTIEVLLQQQPDGGEHTSTIIELLTDIYMVIPWIGKLNQSVTFDVGRATIAIKSNTTAELKLLRQLMSQTNDKPAIQKACCLLISTYVVQNMARSTPIAEIERAVADCRSLMCNCMQVHKNDERVLMAAMYSNMIVLQVGDNLVLDKAGLVSLSCIFDAIAFNQANTALQLLACSCFESFLLKQCNQNTWTDILTCSIRMCSNSSEPVAMRACQVVASCLKSCPDASKASTSMEVVATALIFALEVHFINPDIVQHLCNFTTFIFTSPDTRHMSTFANCGGLNSVLRCLGASDCIEDTLHKALLETLIRTVNAADDVLVFAHRLSVSHNFIRALDCMVANKEMIGLVLQSMMALCMRDEFFQIILAAGIPALQRLMSHHFTDYNLALHVTRLILMATTADNSLRLAKSPQGSLIQQLVNLMLAHSKSKDLIVDILDILRLLKAESATQEDLDEKTFLAAILATMRANRRRPEVLGSALAAISNIIVNFARPSIRPMKSDTFDALVAAMSQHPVDEWHLPTVHPNAPRTPNT
ncbi:hypothetical protein MPSEU_000646300 [Mayamaea pseudoterrestris]|nr:hypothetical protein MPSEU_000646300 [Mayamaea pseudoterrestris]